MNNDTITLQIELSEEAPAPVKQKVAQIDLDREAWLTRAAQLIHNRNDLPFSVSYGFGKGGNRSRKGWSVHNDTAQLPQLFIHPDTKDGVDLLCRIASATLPHDGIEFNSLHSILENLGEFPSNPLDTEIKKDTVRQIKCVCPSCGFTMRTSRRWIEKGLPTCACGTKITIA